VKLVVSLLFSLLGVGCNRCMNGSMGGGGDFWRGSFLELFDLLVELECVPERGFFKKKFKKKREKRGVSFPKSSPGFTQRGVFFSGTAYIVRLRLRVA